jgi:hypothetical protein
MADYIGATPQNPLLGLLYGGYDYLRSPQRTQQMQGLASLLESTGIPKTIERMSYGEPLTNIGQANVPLLKPETAEAMMTVAPMAGPVARATAKGVQRAGGLLGQEMVDRLTTGRSMLPSLLAEPQAAMFARLPDTPTFTDPRVGKRFDTEYVGNLVDRTPLNIEDYEGYSLLTFPSDITSRGQKVKGFSDIVLDRPTITEGGFSFPRDKKNIEDMRGYASMLAAAQRQNNRVIRAIEENKALGGREKVLVGPHTMAYGAEDFSTMPTDALISLFQTVGAKPEIISEINRRIRDATIKGEKGKFSEFVGLGDSGLREQLFTGAGLTKGSAGDLRKLFTEKMGSVYGEKAFDYNYPDLRRSLLDTNLVDVPKYHMGETFYEAMPFQGLLSGAHSTYSHGMGGVYRGTTKSLPVKDVFGQKYADIYNQTKESPKVANQLALGRNLDLDQLAMGALSSGESNTGLFLDEKTIKRLKKMMKD